MNKTKSNRSRRQKPNVERAQSIAESHGGKCLTEVVSSVRDELTLKCRLGHEWTATYDSLIHGKWCPDCGGTKKLTLEVAQKLAQSRNGECLSLKYQNSWSPLQWRCENHHEWDQSLSVIKAGTWCPKCAVSGHGQGIGEMQSIATLRGGACLSSNYVNARSKLLWQCRHKHKPWEATPDDIKRGRWCPSCASSLGERIVRAYFEAVFQVSFLRVRPNFLKNPKTGENLELDGYNKDLGIAFEHQGRQHFSPKDFFKWGHEEKSLRIRLDQLKRNLCAEAGVKLVEIPSVPDRLPLGHLKQFLIDEFLKLGIRHSEFPDLSTLDLSDAFSPDSAEILKEMKSIAAARGGMCLSRTYLTYHAKLIWKCGVTGHQEWTATPAKILAGRWCPECGGRKKKTLADAQRLAESFSGRCLSKRYASNKKKLHWECPHGHSWDASYDSVSRGSRCPKCFNIKRKNGS